MKKQIKPNKAERTGAQPLRKEITSSPQASGPIGRQAKTVKAIKSIPNIMVNIFQTPIDGSSTGSGTTYHKLKLSGKSSPRV